MNITDTESIGNYHHQRVHLLEGSKKHVGVGRPVNFFSLKLLLSFLGSPCGLPYRVNPLPSTEPQAVSNMNMLLHLLAHSNSGCKRTFKRLVKLGGTVVTGSNLATFAVHLRSPTSAVRQSSPTSDD